MSAGWGYPEPYTRDLLIASLGILVSENDRLTAALRKVLSTLARNQSPLGHIPSLVHDPEDRGASDTTPLFLMATALYRRATGERSFLEAAVEKALMWMSYQSPSDRVIVAQLPTSDWRDEQWVIGYGLYVNTILYISMRLLGVDERADELKDQMSQFTIVEGRQHKHVHEGLRMPNKPYYALWSYKLFSSERFDLLGNSLALLAGLASPNRASRLSSWIEAECQHMMERGELAVNLCPNFFPFIRPDDPDWRERYMKYNMPGEYHNGGVWPFISGFHIAALVAAKRPHLAEEKLAELTELVGKAANPDISFGFNEWHKAQDGSPRGQDWQTWSAAMYLYAAACVERGSTPFLDSLRDTVSAENSSGNG